MTLQWVCYALILGIMSVYFGLDWRTSRAIDGLQMNRFKQHSLIRARAFKSFDGLFALAYRVVAYRLGTVWIGKTWRALQKRSLLLVTRVCCD